MTKESPTIPEKPAEKPRVKPHWPIIGNSKTFSLPMYGLIAGMFACVMVVSLALFAPTDRFQPAVDSLTQIATIMLGLAGAGGITLGVRDMATKGVTSSNSEAAVEAVKSKFRAG
jgi:hypothetical protein